MSDSSASESIADGPSRTLFRAADAVGESDRLPAEELSAIERLHEISTRLIQGGDVDILYRQIVDAAAAIMRSDTASMQLLYSGRGECGELVLLAHHGFRPDTAAALQWRRMDDRSVCGETVRTSCRTIVHDIETCEFIAGTAGQESYRQAGIRAVQTTPLMSRGGRVLGMLSTHWRWPHQPADRDLRLLDILARQAADLIERTQKEQALRESEERFSRFMQHLPGLAWIKDDQGRYVFVNDAAERAFRHGRTDLLGKTDEEVFPPATAAQFRDNDRQVAATHARIEVVETLEHDDGIHHSLVNKFPISGRNGDQAMIGGIAIDMTERIAAERKLRESDERMRLATRGGRIGVWDWDITADYVTWTDSLYAIHGVRPEQFEPTVAGFAKLVHPDDLARVQSMIEQSLASDKAYEVEFRAVRPDGEVISLFTNASVLREDGRPVRMLGVTTDITPVKRAEEALRSSEERFRTLASYAPVGIFLTDPDGRTQFVNESWCRMTGLATETACGDAWASALHDEDRTRVVSGWNAAIQASVASEAEFRFVRTDGEVTWVHGNAVPLRNAAGELTGYIGTIADITERKRSELALRESELRFHNLADNISQLAWMADEHGWIFWYNRRWFEYTGTTLEEMQGWGWMKVHHPDHVDRVVDRIQASWDSGEPWEDLFPLRGKEGEYRWFLSRAMPIRDAEGRVVRWFGTNTDITSQRTVEEALRNSERLYRAIGESIDYGVWVCDSSGRNLYASDSFLQLVGLTQEECSNFGWSNVLHPDDIEATVAAWQECVRSGENWDREHRFRGADGRWHSILARGAPVRNEQGEITAWAGINLDIGRLKQVEEELLEADRRKDEFLATLAHELRNPLAPICTGLELMRVAGNERALVEEVRATMDRQARQLVRLVDDLLDVSRITRGRVELKKCHVELRSIIESAVEASRPLVEEWGHELSVSLPAMPILLEADAARLAQVFSNLLNNAAKYMQPRGQIVVTVEQRDLEAVVTVKDTGIGIPHEMLDRIFDLFTQVDRSLERSHSGLGIGLTLVKRLVEMHGGTVEARSDGPEQGSEFIVKLPFVPGESEEDRPLDAQRPAAAAKLRVLVADDNVSAATMLSMLLKMLGNDVRTANDGLEALQTAAEFRPDVMLLDIGMPGLNGHDTARRVRSEDWGRDILLVAVTGWGQVEDRRRSREAGFDHHFVKPIEPEALAKLLRERRPRRA